MNQGVTASRQTSDESVRVKPDLSFPKFFKAEVRTDAYPELQFSIHAEWNNENLSYDMKTLEIDSPKGISGEDLRGLSRDELMRSSNVLLTQVEGPDGAMQSWVTTRQLFLDSTAAGPTPETLLLVARLYAHSRAFGGPANKSVMRSFSVSQRTATRWIALARERGLLD